MGHFNKGGGGRFGNRGGGRDFGGNRGGRDFGDRGGRPNMHRATCSACGKPCEVPFKPTGDKPVYCSDCFKNSDKAGGRDFGKKDFGRRDGGRDRGRPEMHRATCSECGKPCEVPFKPTGDKPVYCDSCFGGAKESGFSSRKTDENRQEFDRLNKKLDRIIKALEEAGIKKEAPIVKPAEEAAKTPEKKAAKKAAKKAIKKTVKKPATKKKSAKK
ncbi:hypothetical protein JW752_04250 [Candidatus Peregrinibacteria bacterium]|nr:hypothetical protein [Candidatus Peregrinibacteria bacterium]